MGTLSAAELAEADAARLRTLVVDQYQFVWRSLRRVGVSDSDAEDLCQEVFMVVARKIADILPGKERSFLFGVCVRVAATHRRTLRRRPEDADDLMAERRSAAPGPEELTEQRRARSELDAVLATLPEELRTVFVLYELEELSTPEIAALLEMPIGTAASRLRRAREAFKQAVARRTGRAAFKSGIRASTSPFVAAPILATGVKP